jgi:hypothetical protein
MNFLIDTNILIPLEPATNADECQQSKKALEFHSALLAAGHIPLVHPASKEDISHDKDLARRRFRELHISKYPLLADPPVPSNQTLSIIGDAERASNDWIDNQLIAAVVEDAVNFLVSEDRGIRSKANRLGVGTRVLTIEEALSLISDLSDKIEVPPPSVKAVKAYYIKTDDPILESLRADYPNFDDWFARCRREHRQSWIIPGEGGYVAGLCVINHEKDPPTALSGKVLKICSFKISECFNGFRYGELLLRAVFEHANSNQYNWVFLTVFQKHFKLIELLGDFGFRPLESQTEMGEFVLAKPMEPIAGVIEANPVEFFIRYGPNHFLSGVEWYVIPIRPVYSDVLFPETAYQGQLFQGIYPFGNSIRKAYLCHSKIKDIPVGSVAAFYRSQNRNGIVAIGIIERIFRSSSAQKIAQLVGKRTVYSMSEIQNMCQKTVLAILFRQARGFMPEIPLKDLISGGVFKIPPQSIIRISQEGISCLKKKLG